MCAKVLSILWDVIKRHRIQNAASSSGPKSKPIRPTVSVSTTEARVQHKTWRVTEKTLTVRHWQYCKELPNEKKLKRERVNVVEGRHYKHSLVFQEDVRVTRVKEKSSKSQNPQLKGAVRYCCNSSKEFESKGVKRRRRPSLFRDNSMKGIPLNTLENYTSSSHTSHLTSPPINRSVICDGTGCNPPKKWEYVRQSKFPESFKYWRNRSEQYLNSEENKDKNVSVCVCVC